MFLRKRSNVAVGRDVRLSGDQLRNGLVTGLVKGGCDVTDLGVISTPILEFATNLLKKDAGIMITASHNPPEWNGFKLFSQNGCIYGDKMEKIKKIAQNLDLKKLGEKQGKVISYDKIFRDYSDFISKHIKLRRKLRLVADAANGVCGLFAPSLFKA